MQGIIYSDLIGHISVERGMVRMDLYTEIPSSSPLGEGSRSAPAITHRLVMPLAGFVQSFPILENIMHEMEKQGAIIRAPANAND